MCRPKCVQRAGKFGWIDEEVLQVIDRLIESGVPVQTVETPVYDFPRAGAPAH